MGAEAEKWRDALDEMFSLTVIPYRSVDQVRRALDEGRDPEPYLEEIECGLRLVGALAERLLDAPPCPACFGTGCANPPTHALGRSFEEVRRTVG